MDIAAALLLGFLLDIRFGDPPWMPHPVVAIGKAIALCERVLRRILPKTAAGETAAGALVALFVGGGAYGITLGLLAAAGGHPLIRLALESFMCYQILAARCLADSATRVRQELQSGNIEKARRAVAHIVGRDTQTLGFSAVARATVETVAENASDGVVAPMVYFAIGGAPLAMLYKAINTMDSMLGYKNEKYLHFGRIPARLDDIANLVPARLTALLMIPAAALAGLDWLRALRIWRRDRKNHASPNSAQPEAACAGALGVLLGGALFYSGRLVHKPTIGDASRPIQAEDIRRANRLMYITALLTLGLCVAARLALVHFQTGTMPWN